MTKSNKPYDTTCDNMKLLSSPTQGLDKFQSRNTWIKREDTSVVERNSPQQQEVRSVLYRRLNLQLGQETQLEKSEYLCIACIRTCDL